MEKSIQDKSKRVWDLFTEEEKKRLQDCLNTMKINFHRNSADSLDEILVELRNKYGLKTRCMYCGQRHKGSCGLCKTCKTRLIRTRRVDMAEEEPQNVWERISEEDKKRLQDCLNNVELKVRMNSDKSLNQLLIELRDKYGVKNRCLYCGKPHKGLYGLCRTCKTQLIRKKDVNMGKEEVEKLSDATNPENLHWAFVDIENAKRISQLFTPGHQYTWTQMQVLSKEFAKLKENIENTVNIKEHTRCLVCGQITRSSKGLCAECRAYIYKHGCTKPMREGDYKANSSTISVVSQLSRSPDEQTDKRELYPLVKIR